MHNAARAGEGGHAHELRYIRVRHRMKQLQCTLGNRREGAAAAYLSRGRGAGPCQRPHPNNVLGCSSIRTLKMWAFDTASVAVRGATPLMMAAATQDDDIIQLLLAAGAGLETADDHGESVLYYGVRSGRLATVRHLVESCGARVNVRNKLGEYPLHAACAEGHSDVAAWLVGDGGARLDARDQFGNTPLMFAARAGHTSCVHCLLQATPPQEADGVVNARNCRGLSALLAAAFWGHVDCVRLLISAGADVDVVDCNGLGLLPLALWQDNVRVVEFLISVVGVDATARLPNGLTPLCLAAWRASIACVSVLAAACPRLVNVPGSAGDTPLHHAARSGNAALVAVLAVDALADPNIPNAEGLTPVMLAGCCEDPTGLLLLLNQGGDLTGAGVIVFKEAVAAGRLPCVRALVGRGLFPTEPLEGGRTCVEVAAKGGKLAMVRFLLPRAALHWPETFPRIVRASLLAAVQSDALDVVTWLVREVGVLPDVVDDLGCAVVIAATSGALSVLRFLVSECGVPLESVDAGGLTPLLTLAAAGNLDAVKMLVENGAVTSGE